MSSFTVEKNTVLKIPQSLLFRDNLTLSTKFSTGRSCAISPFSCGRKFAKMLILGNLRAIIISDQIKMRTEMKLIERQDYLNELFELSGTPDIKP